MDIEKLIERLQNAAGGPEGIEMCQNAATALSTLQTENERLHRRLSEATSARSLISARAQNTDTDNVEGVSK